MTDYFTTEKVKPLLKTVLDEILSRTVFKQIFADCLPNGMDTSKLGRICVKKKILFTGFTYAVEHGKPYAIKRNLFTPERVYISLSLTEGQDVLGFNKKYNLKLSYTFLDMKWLRLKSHWYTNSFTVEGEKFNQNNESFETYILNLIDGFNKKILSGGPNSYVALHNYKTMKSYWNSAKNILKDLPC